MSKPKTKADANPEIAAREEANAAAFEIVEGQIQPAMINGVIELVKRLAKSFKELDEFQQGDFIGSVQRRIGTQLAQAMRVLAAAEHPCLAAQLVSFTVKDTEVKITLETAKTTENLIALGKVGEGQLDVIFTDLRKLDDKTLKQVEAEPDQPKLPIEQAADAADEAPPPPADDSDLAGEGNDDEG